MNERLSDQLRFLSLAGKIGVIAASAAILPLSAQTQEQPQEERVVVTGSRISRLDVEGPSPVYTITREEIENSGVTQISDLMRNLAYNSGVQEADAVASFAGDASQFNLRGLGVNGTLVLVNGRRIAPHAFSTSFGDNFVDLNSIPPSAIERIEILKDGASAVYGSDALAGVVNFILRDDFEGLELESSFGRATSGTDFHVLTINGALGITSGKGSLKVFTNYYKRSALQLADRGFSASADQTPRGGWDWTSGSSYPGIFRPILPPAETDPVTGAPIPPPPHGMSTTVGGSPGFIGNATGQARTWYDYNTRMTNIPEAKRYGLTLIGDYMLSDKVTLFTELTYQRNWAWSQFAPAPSVGDFTVPAHNPYNPTNPANSTFVPGLIDNSPTAYPDGIDLSIQFRPTDPGDRHFETTTQMVRALFGTKGEIFDGWDWEVNYLYTASRVDDLTRNLLYKPAIQDMLNQTDPALALNPFASVMGLNNNPALYDAGKVSDERNSTLDVSQFQALLTGQLFDLPAGPVGAAFGAEYREESIEDLPSAASGAGNLIGSGGTSSEGNRQGKALFAEVSVPVIKQIELKGAVRWDDYSDFSDSTIFTVGATFRPVDSILLRSTYSEGFKAPSLPQAYGGQTRGFPPPRADTILAAITGNPNMGQDRQFTSITGGNPNLEPEESETFNIGILVQPERMIPALQGLTFGVDWWKLKATNLITTRSSNAILADEFAIYQNNPAAFLAQDPVARAQTTRVLREPNATYTDANGNPVTGPGYIEDVFSVYENLNRVKIEGFDLEVAYRREFEIGQIDIRNTWVRLRNSDSGGGNQVGGWAVPKWRYNGSYGWSKGDYGVTMLLNHVSAYDEYYSFFPFPPFEDARVGSWTTLDVRVSYKGIANTKVTVGIDNVFGKDPPLSVSESSGHERYFHSPVGRFVWVSVNRRF
jgi:iron complex outermembrane receptor protein